jgi:drug/metabolite transporter (DMT)-like permease
MAILYRLLAIFVVIVWGLSFTATRALFAMGMSPFGLLTLRIFAAWLILIVISHKQGFADTVIDELKFMLLGVACVPFYYGLENMALYETQAGTVAALMACAPLMTALIVMVRYRHFRLHWMAKLGIFAAATGAILVLFDSQIMRGLSGKGSALAFGAAFAWAVYSALLKTIHNYDGAYVARKALGWGFVASIPFALAEGKDAVAFLSDPAAASLILFLAAGPTTLCTVLWNRAAVVAGVKSINNYLYWVPIVTIIAGMLFLDEYMTFVGIMGTVIICCGVWSAEIGMKRVSAVLSGADPEKLSAKISFD